MLYYGASIASALEGLNVWSTFFKRFPKNSLIRNMSLKWSHVYGCCGCECVKYCEEVLGIWYPWGGCCYHGDSWHSVFDSRTWSSPSHITPSSPYSCLTIFISNIHKLKEDFLMKMHYFLHFLEIYNIFTRCLHILTDCLYSLTLPMLLIESTFF